MRTLSSMAAIHARHGTVAFERKERAGRFARDQRTRHGETIIPDLAEGRDDRLAGDSPDADKRRAIARAVIAAAKEHESLGLSLRDVEKAERKMRDRERGRSGSFEEAAPCNAQGARDHFAVAWQRLTLIQFPL